MNILVGCEESQAVTIELRKQGHEAYSCDIKNCSGDHPEWHLQMDVFDAIALKDWDMGIFFPDCTYLTCSAEWAYSDPNYDKYPSVGYHQRIKPGTLVGKERRDARKKAVQFVKGLWNCGIDKISLENPVGVLSRWKKPSQKIHPYQFGDDASKKTCLWLIGLPVLVPTTKLPGRIVEHNGKMTERWGNQTDSGQNKLTPSDNRSELRSKTYPGIAKAMADQWT